MLKETYQSALEARRGSIRLDPVFDGLVQDLRAAYGVAPLWIQAAVGWEGARKGRPILEVVVERTGELWTMRKGPQHPLLGHTPEPMKVVARMVLERFSPEALRRIFPLPDGATPDWPRDLMVTLHSFESWTLDHAITLTPDDSTEFERSLGLGDALWMTSRIARTVVVFVHTDEQARALRAAGIPEAWARAYVELARKHDEFGYLHPGWIRMEVDSKETFDRDWKGDYLAYMR
ncbi:hypothetical protein ICW40_15685 [Actinotalea ferrariae]|uniref:hypothetical protein n=1 Tax=Actinotalea ferrariae TaxID=1386098 RepID=UPI001C8C48E6|nr:hypothetical protein [Actinotalea ferrariae]MBX9246239.1 hypothetical protein [Actinotalea ferrariae]